MAAAEQMGIGVRCNEGFGRIAFNHPLYDQRTKLGQTWIELPDDLGLAGDNIELHFMEKWQMHVNSMSQELLEHCSHAVFGAVARWLYLERNTKPSVLAEQLGALYT
ncbi:MAG: hypothetical protein R3E79_61100 [Caldilineaceae bacterium]